MTRARLRDLGITIGRFTPGPFNAITDVPGVWVGHATLIADSPRIARTGVTVILPREGRIWQDNAFAGFHVLNGCGEMTGIHWLQESGLLSSPIALTNTHQVGTVHEALIAYCRQHDFCKGSALPVVAETYDGWLNDLDALHVTKDHVYAAIAAARSGPVAEGNVGGGTGMICHDFKGGIGTSSRLLEISGQPTTVGALVQANHGDRDNLRVNGVPVGREISDDKIPLAWGDAAPGGSLLVILATDAPLLPGQCRRLAQRATIGMARVGGIGHNGSGDLFLAFATGNLYPADVNAPLALVMSPQHHLNDLFEAAAEAVEEAILNCLTAAETMTGIHGNTAYALPLDLLVEVMGRWRPVG